MNGVNKEAVLVSLVVPIYNVENYLSECIESIIGQRYKNIEIILVNDGSTDNCEVICKEYVAKDSRIVLVNKKNGGLSEARNVGLAIAKGEYICFIDSDDYISECYVSSMLNKAISENADIVCCGFYKKKEQEIIDEICVDEQYAFSNKQALIDIFSAKSKIYPVAWNKLYKRSIFVDNNIIYPIGKLHEDELTTYKLLYFSEKIVVLNQSLYSYRIRANSIMRNKFGQKRMEFINELTKIEEFINNNSPDLNRYANNNTIYKIYGLVKNCALLNGEKAEYEYIKMRLKEKILLENSITAKRRFQINLSLILPYSLYKQYIRIELHIYRIRFKFIYVRKQKKY